MKTSLYLKGIIAWVLMWSQCMFEFTKAVTEFAFLFKSDEFLVFRDLGKTYFY